MLNIINMLILFVMVQVLVFSTDYKDCIALFDKSDSKASIEGIVLKTYIGVQYGKLGLFVFSVVFTLCYVRGIRPPVPD